jgi:hypothetical protein
VRLALQTAQMQDVKVWAHAITPEGHSEPLTLRMPLMSADRAQSFDVKEVQGKVVVPVHGVPMEIRLETGR